MKKEKDKKPRRQKKQKKYRFRNLSIRMSFMVYMLAFSLLAIILIVGTVAFFSTQQSNLYWEYESQNYDPDTGRRIVRPIMPLDPMYDADGEPIPFEDALLSDNSYIVYDADGVAIGISYGGYTMPEDVREMYDLYGLLQLLSIPFWVIICLMWASHLFYRNKLKEPIAILQNASMQIAQDNLDFHIVYSLRDEMGQLCTSFEKMRAALYANHAEMWRAMEERKRLNAAFSHDLRTPLTVLHGYTEMLSDRLPDGGLTPAQVQDTLGAMSGQLTRLERYVEDMQALQRLEDVAVNPRPVDAGPFAEELEASASILCGGAGLRLTFSTQLPDRALMIDPGLVANVYENLLSNAVWFAREGITVLVAGAADALSITVVDDGHGFSAESLAKAKNPFYSGGNTDGSHFGLGLNIADILCAKHGGHLSLSNGQNGGARVEAIFSEIDPSH